MAFFSQYNKIEKKMLAKYTEMLREIGILDAQRTSRELLNRAVEKSKKEGTYNLPPNFGDIILGEQKTEKPNVKQIAEKIQRTLPSKRAEGVTDKDIKSWWNLNDVERNMMLGVDEFHRLALFIKLMKENGLSEKEASERVWKFHPKYTYGYRGEMKKMAKESRDRIPLPIELKDRVNKYIEKRAKNDPEQYKKDIEKSSTFNALVRKEIQAGNL